MDTEPTAQKRVVFATIGTRGDVQPYLALAVALQAHGYSVGFGATEEFEPLIASYGVEFHSLGPSIADFLHQSRFEKAMSQSMLINGPALLRQGQRILDDAARRAWVMAQGADLILLNMNVSFGIDIAEALDIPVIMMALQPLTTTSEFPFCAYDGPDFGKTFNQLTHSVTVLQQAYYDLPRNKWRRELMGLERRKKGGFFKDTKGRHLTTLYAYSTTVSPRPRDWPKEAVVTGYWPLPDNTNWQPSREFRAFLDAGPPPVYIGFGSMPFGAERNTRILKDAMAIWGGRAVVARGWGGINPEHLPDTVFAFDQAPHDKLFSHVAGVVHHGGAGTTAAGLHAGKPTFVVPQTVDQPFWGRRVFELGCGPAPVRLRRLTDESLADNLANLAGNRFYAENAARIGRELAGENGTGKAIQHVERVLANYRPRNEQRRA
ncbi:MAG: glycosyltransferase [Alphaproteobacteria bacterium]|nr:glycosyltransferase [Alphaproteobacteria bacterium]